MVACSGDAIEDFGVIASPPCRDSTQLAQGRGTMRRRRFQRGGLSQRKRNGRLYWYLQWREDGRPRSKELGLCSEISRAQAEVKRTAMMEPLNKGILKPTKPVYTLGQFIEAIYLPVSRRRWKV